MSEMVWAWIYVVMFSLSYLLTMAISIDRGYIRTNHLMSFFRTVLFGSLLLLAGWFKPMEAPQIIYIVMFGIGMIYHITGENKDEWIVGKGFTMTVGSIIGLGLHTALLWWGGFFSIL